MVFASKAAGRRGVRLDEAMGGSGLTPCAAPSSR